MITKSPPPSRQQGNGVACCCRRLFAASALQCIMQHDGPFPRCQGVMVVHSAFLPIWHLNGCQRITVNSGVSGPKFTKFLCDMERTSGVLMHSSAFLSYHPLWNASPKKEDVSSISADFAPKIGCHGNIPWAVVKHEIETSSSRTCSATCLPMSKIWWSSVW